MDFYKTKQNEFGLTLDRRKPYTKLDWTLLDRHLDADASGFRGAGQPRLAFPK